MSERSSLRERSVAAVKPAPLQASSSSLALTRCRCGGTAGPDGECAACRQKRLLLQRAPIQPNAAPPSLIPQSVHRILQQPGSGLASDVREKMETRFSHDFSGVRVHTGALAAESASAVRARAFAVGNHLVFNQGQFAPETPVGARLLAHELAHAIQQSGIPLSSGIQTGSAPEHALLERDAENAARLFGDSSTAPIQVRARPVGTILSRQGENDLIATAAPGVPPPAPETTLTEPPPEPEVSPPATPPAPVAAPSSNSAGATAAPTAAVQPARQWVDLPGDSPLRSSGIVARQDMSPDLVGFQVSQFRLPGIKGNVLNAWKARAAAQALEGTIEFEGASAPRTGLWASRDRTRELRNSWIAKIGWANTEQSLKENWHRIGGASTPAGRAWRPRVGNETCQMDHIIELQVGGTNIRENVQVLDENENQTSGRTIWEQVRQLAISARQTVNPAPRYILLHFNDVVQDSNPPAMTVPAPPGGATSCAQVEQCALAEMAAPAAGAAGGRVTEPYRVIAGGSETNLMAFPAPETTELSGDDNRAASQLVPGMLLRNLSRASGARDQDTINAVMDSSNLLGNAQRTRIPIVLQNPPNPIVFVVNEQRQMNLTRPRRPGFDFFYPYLSQGHIDLEYDPQTGVRGTGRLTPSIPLLNRIAFNLELGDGRLRASVGVPPERLRSPIPGLRFTRAEFGADLLPEFNPAGIFAFEIGPVGRALFTGEITATADASGLVMNGSLVGHLPNIDEARGDVMYRAGQWSGMMLIRSDQVRIPGVREASLQVNFSNEGPVLSGNILIGVANQEVNLEARRRNQRWVYVGRGRFNLPGLNPISATVTTDGTRTTAEGETTFNIRDLTGTLRANYDSQRGWSGTATAALARGRANGSVTINLNPNGRMTGQGNVSYRITDNLTASVGVLLREDRSIRVNGDLVFGTIPLFRRLDDRRRLYQFPRISIPIFGISLGPIGDVGLVARIDAEIGASYGIGAGEVRNARAGVAFDLFAETPNIEFDAGAQLYIPFNAGFYLTVRGSVALSAIVASVSGGVSVTGELGLNGEMTGNTNVLYRANRFALHADVGLRARPRVTISIDADVRAEAGIGPFTTEAVKRWNLAGRSWGGNLEFGFLAGLDYASDQPFRMPSFESIQWIYPRNLDFENLVTSFIN